MFEEDSIVVSSFFSPHALDTNGEKPLSSESTVYIKKENMKKILELFPGLLGGLIGLSLVLFLGFVDLYGIYHSFSKHNFTSGVISVFVPPFALYRAAEGFYWHDDFSNDASLAQPKPDGKIVEYIDNEYAYAFLFPSDWKMVAAPPKGESGEVRVIMKSPKSTQLMVIVAKLESSISKQAFVNNPNSNTIVEAMINYTIESVYKKTSREVGASRMVVSEKHEVPSEIAVKFFVSTTHFIKTEKGELPVVVAGIHYIPFEKDQLITLLMTSPLNPKATDENETVKNVLNSFHLVGEKPL